MGQRELRCVSMSSEDPPNDQEGDSLAVHLEELLDSVSGSIGSAADAGEPPSPGAAHLPLDTGETEESMSFRVDEVLTSVSQSVAHLEPPPASEAAGESEELAPRELLWRLSPTGSRVILYHANMKAAQTFYGKLLGLTLRDASTEWVSYWVTDKREMCLCISSSDEERERYGAAGRGVVIDFVVADVDATFARLAAAGVNTIYPPKDKPWGARTASVRDPAGYLLTFSSPLGGEGPIDS